VSSSVFDEGAVRFTFDHSWQVLKWDDCDFRALRAQHGKAADFLGLWRGDGGALFAIEVKDYPDRPEDVSVEPASLAQVCSEKVRDSLAQLLFLPPLAGRPSDQLTDDLARSFGSTDYPIHFGLWVSDARSDGLDVVELQNELERAFRWLPAKSIATYSLDEGPWPSGVQVARV
jgi:hypothetical protein